MAFSFGNASNAVTAGAAGGAGGLSQGADLEVIQTEVGALGRLLRLRADEN